MALDSKQKRGSVIGVSLPFRPWLAEPAGALDAEERQSLLYYPSTPSWGEVVEEEEDVGSGLSGVARREEQVRIVRWKRRRQRIRREIRAVEKKIAEAKRAPQPKRAKPATPKHTPAKTAAPPPLRPELTQPPVTLVPAPALDGDLAALTAMLAGLQQQLMALDAAQQAEEDALLEILLLVA